MTNAAAPITNRTARATALAAEVRRILADCYPAHRFSVRSSHYSLGSSVTVSWTDGPAPFRIDALLAPLFPDDNRHAPCLMVQRKATRPAIGASVLLHGSVGVVESVDNYDGVVILTDAGPLRGVVRNCEVLS